MQKQHIWIHDSKYGGLYINTRRSSLFVSVWSKELQIFCLESDIDWVHSDLIRILSSEPVRNWAVLQEIKKMWWGITANAPRKSHGRSAMTAHCPGPTFHLNLIIVGQFCFVHSFWSFKFFIFFNRCSASTVFHCVILHWEGKMTYNDWVIDLCIAFIINI